MMKVSRRASSALAAGVAARARRSAPGSTSPWPSGAWGRRRRAARRRVGGMTWARRAAVSSQSGRSWPSCSARAMAQRRLWQMLDEPVSRANDHGVPSAWRAHRISPRGGLQVEHEVDGPLDDRPHGLDEAAVAGQQPVVPDAGGHVGEDVGVELVLLDPIGQVVLVPGAVGPLAGRPATRRPARPRRGGRRGRGPWPPRRGSTGRRGRRGTRGSCRWAAATSAMASTVSPTWAAVRMPGTSGSGIDGLPVGRSTWASRRRVGRLARAAVGRARDGLGGVDHEALAQHRVEHLLGDRG